MSIPLRHRVLLIALPFVVAGLSWVGALRHARDSISDLLFTARTVPKGIAIIAIDEESIHAIGQWPWPRATFGTVLSRLGNARSIGFDINFKEPSRLGAADDRAFADKLSITAVPVVLASELQPDSTVIGPIAPFAAVSTQGVANVTIDKDGIVRTIQLWRGSLPFLANEVAIVATGRSEHMAGPSRIRYVGPNGTILSYSFIDVLNGKIPAETFDGQMVLIGATARDLQDYDQTPLGLMSGVEIQANVLANVLANDFLKTSPIIDALITLATGLLALMIGLLLRRVWLLLLVLLVSIVVVWIAVFTLFEGGLLLDLVMPTIAVLACGSGAILARYTATARERRFIHDTFSHYLAPQVISELLQDPSKVRLGGQKRELTILFSDIRGFTSLSETMGPQELAQFLNRYLGEMTDIILDQRGVIDKYIGDAIMAFWGAPLDDDRHALNGVRSALAMVSGLEAFNASGKADNVPPIAVGIGLNTGSVTVGNMGSEKRFDYTVIGDEVNLASRLESLTKTYGVAIIISANTLNSISEADRKEFAIITREIDRVRVKGKSQPVILHEVMAPAVAARIVPHRALFDDALTAYYSGHWPLAISNLDAFVAVVGKDGPSALLKERCQEFLQDAPESWDGVFEMKHK